MAKDDLFYCYYVIFFFQNPVNFNNSLSDIFKNILDFFSWGKMLINIFRIKFFFHFFHYLLGISKTRTYRINFTPYYNSLTKTVTNTVEHNFKAVLSTFL